MKITLWSLVLGLLVLTGACGETTQTSSIQTQAAPSDNSVVQEDLGTVEADSLAEALEKVGPSVLRSNLSSLEGKEGQPGHVVYNQLGMQGSDFEFDKAMTHYQANGYASVSFLRDETPGTIDTVLFRLDEFPENGTLGDINTQQLKQLSTIGYFRFQTDEQLYRNEIDLELHKENRNLVREMGINYLIFNPQNELSLVVGIPLDDPEQMIAPRNQFFPGFANDGSERVGRVVFHVVKKSDLPPLPLKR